MNITPRWQNSKMGVSRSGRMTAWSHEENRYQFGKTFQLITYMIKLWKCNLIMYILCVSHWSRDHSTVVHFHAFTLSRPELSSMSPFVWGTLCLRLRVKVSKGNFRPSQCIGWAGSTPITFCLKVSRFCAVEIFTQLLEPNPMVYNCHIFEVKNLLGRGHPHFIRNNNKAWFL